MDLEKVDLSGNIEVPQGAEVTPTKKSFMMSLSLSNVNARDWLQKKRESVRPWGEFIATSNFQVPKSIAPLGVRIVKNVERFQSNYLFIFLGLVIFCVITSPMLLIAIAASLGACYIISLKNQDQKIKIAGRELSLVQQYGAVGALSFPLFWIAGAGSAVFWIIGASFVVIMAHAGLYKIQDDVDTIEEMESLTIGEV